MSELEKLIKSIRKDKKTVKQQTTNSTTDDSKKNPNFKEILKLFINERKRMWESVLDCIESIENDRAQLNSLLVLDGENNELIEQNDEFASRFNESNSVMCKTFNQSNFEIDENLYGNNSTNDYFQNLNSTNDYFQNLNSTPRDNGVLIEPDKLTPIPKVQVKRNKQRTKRKSILYVKRLATIEESIN